MTYDVNIIMISSSGNNIAAGGSCFFVFVTRQIEVSSSYLREDVPCRLSGDVRVRGA